MTQEEKDLLLKDLCARLPYGVKVQTTYISPQTKERIDIGTEVLSTVEISMLIDGYEEHKPYLFPLSSMTEEQEKEWNNLSFDPLDVVLEGKFNGKEERLQLINKSMIDPVQWCYKNHFDVYGLIPMDLAIDCTNLNIY